MPRGCTRRPVTGRLPLCVAPSSPASPSLASEGEPRGHHPLRAWVPSSQAALSDPAGVGVCAALQTAALFLPTEPYTCGACGIQFQFYNNLLEHMQSHAGKDPAQARAGCCSPLRSLSPGSYKRQGQPGSPGQSVVTQVVWS